MIVLINDGKGGRKKVEVKKIKDLGLSVLVQLPDGNVIKRKKKRDLPGEGEKTC